MKERSIITQAEIRKIPTLKALKERIVPAGVNILINDVGASEEWENECRQLLSPSIEFVEPEALSTDLREVLYQSNRALAGVNTAVVYPKRGGLAVQKSIDLRSALPDVNLQEFGIEAFRSYRNAPPTITAPRELINSLQQGLFKAILVVDDVIVTGETLREVQQEIYRETDKVDESRYVPDLRFSWADIEIDRLPIKWYAASWLTYAKHKVQASTLLEYQRVFTGIYYKGEKGQPPLNSISTWVYDERKGQQVLTAYAQKYATNPEGFCRFIAELRGR